VRCAPFADSEYNKYNVAWAELYFRTKWCLHPSSRLATIDMHAKNWVRVVCPLFRGSWVPIEHKVAWAAGLPPYQVAYLSPSSRLATMDIGRINWGLGPFRGGGAGSPSNTMSRKLRPTSVQSGILIHAAACHGQNRRGPKMGATPLFGEGLGPHLTRSRVG